MIALTLSVCVLLFDRLPGSQAGVGRWVASMLNVADLPYLRFNGVLGGGVAESAPATPFPESDDTDLGRAARRDFCRTGAEPRPPSYKTPSPPRRRRGLGRGGRNLIASQPNGGP